MKVFPLWSEWSVKQKTNSKSMPYNWGHYMVILLQDRTQLLLPCPQVRWTTHWTLNQDTWVWVSVLPVASVLGKSPIFFFFFNYLKIIGITILATNKCNLCVLVNLHNKWRLWWCIYQGHKVGRVEKWVFRDLPFPRKSFYNHSPEKHQFVSQ